MSARFVLTSSAFLILSLVSCGDVDASRTPAPAAAPAAVQADDTTAQAPLPLVKLARAYAALEFLRPVQFELIPGTDHAMVIEQPGRVLVFENRDDVEQYQVALDFRDSVLMSHNEEGLLAMAFHPDFADNGRVFFYYSASGPRRGVIAEFAMDPANPSQIDPESHKTILAVEQPYGNHNGATLLFGPDGYLYASFGDGGWANDPHNNGQDLRTLLGSIIRIDIDNTSGDKAYAIPEDNPFVDRENARPEIWAYGLRNVWRMSFDEETGQLWAGDVGQNRYEEIDLIVKGGNYGWKLREGKHPFAKSDEPHGELIDPVIEYPRNEGISVTGGYVYRGEAMPDLVGAYVYADYATARIWALRYEDGEVTAQREIYQPSGRPIGIASLGEDENDELIICAFDRPDGREGRLYRIVPRN